MRALANLKIRIPRTEEALLFLLGLVSTWQILQLFGFSFSTLLSILAAGYFVLTRRPVFRRDWLLIGLLIAYSATTILSLFTSLPFDYKKTAITGYIQWIVIFLICIYAAQGKTERKISVFFKGFQWSCRIQLAWCILQILLYAAVKLDLNKFVFADILHFSGETSQYRNGAPVCTGLHWHAANLIPVLVYLYFSHPSVLIKLACVLVTYFTKNATALIGMGLCVFIDCALFLKRTVVDRNGAVKYRTAKLGLAAAVLVIVFAQVIFPMIREVVEYLLLRLYQIKNPSYGNESSAVHFGYYSNLLPILSRIPLAEALFGSGMSTSGYRFTQFFNQYPDMVWAVESDFVNQVLSCGIVGAAAHYAFFAGTAWRLKKAGKTQHVWALLVLAVCGIIYNNQFLWVLQVEMIACTALKNGKNGQTRAPDPGSSRPGESGMICIGERSDE